MTSNVARYVDLVGMLLRCTLGQKNCPPTEICNAALVGARELAGDTHTMRPSSAYTAGTTTIVLLLKRQALVFEAKMPGELIRKGVPPRGGPRVGTKRRKVGSTSA